MFLEGAKKSDSKANRRLRNIEKKADEGFDSMKNEFAEKLDSIFDPLFQKLNNAQVWLTGISVSRLYGAY